MIQVGIVSFLILISQTETQTFDLTNTTTVFSMFRSKKSFCSVFFALLRFVNTHIIKKKKKELHADLLVNMQENWQV